MKIKNKGVVMKIKWASVCKVFRHLPREWQTHVCVLKGTKPLIINSIQFSLWTTFQICFSSVIKAI